MVALFPAAACHMDMDVDEAGGDNGAMEIHDLHPVQALVAFNLFGHLHDLVSGQQDIPHPQVFGSVYIAVFQQFQHIFSSFSGPRSGVLGQKPRCL